MKTLGIIGGLGPMATACFLQQIIEMTDAGTDQEHLDVIVFNRPNVPDRTAYILDNSKPSPAASMTETAKTLETLGAYCLAAPCITSHYVFPEIQRAVGIPLIHMVEETAKYLKAAGKKRAGILATTGTVHSALFQRALRERGLDFRIPDERHQQTVMKLIYDDIKAGKPADMGDFATVAGNRRGQGCDSIILGCTELSVIKKNEKIGPGFLDAMEVLSKVCIETCGKAVKPEYTHLITL